MKNPIKPSNWRTYFGYRPSRSLNWTHYRIKQTAEHDYLDWICRERGWTRAEAWTHINATQKPCGIISSAHGPALRSDLVVKPIRVDPVSRVVTLIRKLPWAAIETIQTAIDERLAA